MEKITNPGKLGKNENLLEEQKNQILKVLLIITLLSCLGHIIYEALTKKKETNNKILLNLKEFDYKIATPEQLKGINVSDLYSHYLGFYGKKATVGDTITFNPNEILERMYNNKFELPNPKNYVVAKQYYEKIIQTTNFSSVIPSSLEKTNINIKESIHLVNSHFDWEKFGSEKLKDNKEKIQLFKELCGQIDEKSLLAYGMTELMSGTNGELNKAILDFMLQYGGEKFVMNIPAIADSYASFGLYQFTSNAIYDTEEERRGASVINQYLPPECKIAGSVTKLATEDHHKAAYMFAMYNLYTLVFKADSEMINALKLLNKQKDNNNLTQLIAIMHNYPANGKVFLEEWYKLNTNKKYLEEKQGKNKEKYNYDINYNKKIDLYEVYVGNSDSKKFDPKRASHSYGGKTYHNFLSLSNQKNIRYNRKLPNKGR